VTHFIDVTLVSRVTIVSGVTLVTYIIATCHWPSKVSFEAFLYPISIKSEGGVKKCFLSLRRTALQASEGKKIYGLGLLIKKLAWGQKLSLTLEHSVVTQPRNWSEARLRQPVDLFKASYFLKLLSYYYSRDIWTVCLSVNCL
jgi:hypothetical protein